MDFLAAILQMLFGLAIVFAIFYAFAQAALKSVHAKLDRLLATQDDLVQRLARVEREAAGRS